MDEGDMNMERVLNFSL